MEKSGKINWISKLLANFQLAAIILVTLYFLFLFVTLKFNPIEWEEEYRVNYSAFFAICAFIGYSVKECLKL